MLRDEIPYGELLVGEISDLRAESAGAKQNQQSIFQWSLATMAAVFGVIAVFKAPPIAAVFGYGLILPLIATAAFLLWLSEVERMERAGQFIRERELALRDPDVTFESPEAMRSHSMMWESTIFDENLAATYGKNELGAWAAVLLFFGAFYISLSAGMIILDGAPKAFLHEGSFDIAAKIASAVFAIAFFIKFVPKLLKIRSTSSGRLLDRNREIYSGAETISLILPCLNEERALPWVLSQVPGNVQVIVSSDGSRDLSSTVARARGAHVIESPVTEGVGSATRRGILASTGTILVLMDCDGTVDPADLIRLVEPLRAGSHQFVVGRRTGSGLTWRREVLIACKRWFVRRRVKDWPIADLGSAQALLASALTNDELVALNAGGGWSLDLALTIMRKWGPASVASVDLPFKKRLGRSKISGSLWGSLRAVRHLQRVMRI
ncbi:glycosyltransferase family 2 protein [Frondihabitans cladoniiphilus]|uniref:Glycosyltransferase 2-like domain-containing protein n=1 Tax=Frondihabitans cladoniiphilus TaxID=715785 RepID=A0ABP8W9A5_9MICO